MTDSASSRRDDPFRWVLDVSAMLMVAPGERESLQRVAQAIGEGMNASGADILSYDAKRESLVQEATWDPDGVSSQDLEFLGTVIPLDESPMFKRLIVSRRVEERHFDDIDLTDDERVMFEEWSYKTTLDAPLIIGDEIVGALGVTEKRYPRHFMTTETQRFEKFASMAAAAIRNMRVFRRDQQHGARLDVLLELSRLLTTSKDLSRALTASAVALVTGLGADWVAVCEAADEHGSPPRLLAWHTVNRAGGGDADGGIDWLSGVAGALATREPHILDATDSSIDDGVQAEMRRRSERMRVSLPLLCHGALVGAVAIAWSAGDPDELAGEIQFAGSAAELLAFALENARLEAGG